jgi:PAS domain S-box-containing protein
MPNAPGSRRPDEPLLTSIHLSPIASVVTDARQPDNPIVAVNHAFLRLTGYEADEVIGRNCRFLAGAKTAPAAQALLRQAVKAGQPALAHVLNYRKNGTEFRNAVMIAPVLDDEGQVAYFLGSQMEVDERDDLIGPARREAKAKVAGLTPRQLQVLAHMIAGYRNKQIAGFLAIDEKTVKMHRAALLARLGVASSAQAIRIGVEAGLEISSAG